MSHEAWITAMQMVDDFAVFVTSMEVLPGVSFLNTMIFCLVLGWIINALANKEP